MNNYSRLFGFESDKKITFHQNSYIPETWMSLDVETVYKIINSAVDIVKTSFSLDDPAMLKIKSDISYTLLKEILSQKFIELVTPFIGNHKYYFDKALTTIKDLFHACQQVFTQKNHLIFVIWQKIYCLLSKLKK